jgi:hypothetical protein
MRLKKFRRRKMSRDKARIKLITEELRKVWEAHSDLRFCQLMTIVNDEVKKECNKEDTFYIEDDVMFDILENLL